MKKIVKRTFSCVNGFLSKTYSCDGIHNWDNGRWSFNRYCEHNQEELSNNRMWEE